MSNETIERWEEIWGTLERLEGVALATHQPGGKPEYEGTTEIEWSNSNTVKDDEGNLVWIDRSGNAFVIKEDEDGSLKRLRVCVEHRSVVTYLTEEA